MPVFGGFYLFISLLRQRLFGSFFSFILFSIFPLWAQLFEYIRFLFGLIISRYEKFQLVSWLISIFPSTFLDFLKFTIEYLLK